MVFRLEKKTPPPKIAEYKLQESFILGTWKFLAESTNRLFPQRRLRNVVKFGCLAIDHCSGWNFQFLPKKAIFGENLHLGVSENRGTPKSSILIGFSIINHPFWDIPISEKISTWKNIGISLRIFFQG